MKGDKITVAQAINNFLSTVKMSRSSNTIRAYQNAMKFFCNSMLKRNFNPNSASPIELPEEAVAWMADDIKDHSPATERLYLTAAVGFYSYLFAEELSTPNLPRIQLLIRQHSRRIGQRLPQFSREKIEFVINYAINLDKAKNVNEAQTLRNLRDRAFILTLADTGLRVQEACSLRRGDLDWNEAKAIIIGKGDRQAVIRFSSRSLSALRDYLNFRAKLDLSSGKQISSLPLFARHDKGTGKKVKPITTATGRNIVLQRVIEALGEEGAGMITPHSFRHYFVTTVLQASGNLKLAQELARHRSISVTQRYAHLSDDELDKGYHLIFEKRQE